MTTWIGQRKGKRAHPYPQGLLTKKFNRKRCVDQYLSFGEKNPKFQCEEWLNDIPGLYVYSSLFLIQQQVFFSHFSCGGSVGPIWRNRPNDSDLGVSTRSFFRNFHSRKKRKLKSFQITKTGKSSPSSPTTFPWRKDLATEIGYAHTVSLLSKHLFWLDQ